MLITTKWVISRDLLQNNLYLKYNYKCVCNQSKQLDKATSILSG